MRVTLIFQLSAQLVFSHFMHLSGAAQTDESVRALDWLRSQMQFDIDPGTGIAKWVKSYETSSIIGAWTYDQALAIIAFTASGDAASARTVLDALRLKQAADGSWDFAYAHNTGAPLDTRIPVGTNAWAVIAVAQYELMTGDAAYRDLALANIDWLLRFRNDNPATETFGAFVMGPDHSSTTWDESTVYSTEHNVDVYAAMRLMHELTQEQAYQTYAEEVYHYLITELWNPSPQSNDPHGSTPAIFWVGFVDYTKYLDPQSWTVAAIGSTGPQGEDFSQALDWAYDNLRVTDASVNGVSGINGFDVNASFDLPVDKVWSEGSEGMVTAYFSTGDPDDSTKAVFFHNETKRYQSANGGVPYATSNPDGWVSFNSVAGTAWLVFNELPINPFRVNASLATAVRRDDARNRLSPPADFQVHPVYPNPFQPESDQSLRVVFKLNRDAVVKLSVYNLLGQRVRLVSDTRLPRGEHVLGWGGVDQKNHPAAAGLYFIKLASEKQIAVRKLMLMR